MFTFGAGVMIGTPLLDANGVAVSNPTPVQFGVLQEITVNESFEIKELYGADAFPVAIGRGKGKMALNAKLANINAELWNTFMYGLSLTQSYEAIYQDLVGASIPTGEQIIPTIHGTALVDLGVQSAVNGIPYTRVATTPTVGQYGFSSASGLYFFSPLDYNKTVFVNYAYGNSAITTGQKLVVTNQPMGVQPVFAVDAQAQYLGKTIYFHYPQVVATKISRVWKNDDFTIYDMDMEAFADSTGVLYNAYFYE